MTLRMGKKRMFWVRLYRKLSQIWKKKNKKTIKQKKNTMIKCTVDVNFQGNLKVELSVKQW